MCYNKIYLHMSMFRLRWMRANQFEVLFYFLFSTFDFIHNYNYYADNLFSFSLNWFHLLCVREQKSNWFSGFHGEMQQAARNYIFPTPKKYFYHENPRIWHWLPFDDHQFSMGFHTIHHSEPIVARGGWVYLKSILVWGSAWQQNV